jgi:hypothetical protein
MNPTGLNWGFFSPHNLEVTKRLCLNLLVVTGMAFAGGQSHAIIHVSAVVRPAARIDVLSTTAVSVFATLYPNVEGLVWAADGSCASPENPKTFGASGRHEVSFSSEEMQGKNVVCFASGDGLLHASARLRQ